MVNSDQLLTVNDPLAECFVPRKVRKNHERSFRSGIVTTKTESPFRVHIGKNERIVLRNSPERIWTIVRLRQTVGHYLGDVRNPLIEFARKRELGNWFQNALILVTFRKLLYDPRSAVLLRPDNFAETLKEVFHVLPRLRRMTWARFFIVKKDVRCENWSHIRKTLTSNVTPSKPYSGFLRQYKVNSIDRGCIYYRGEYSSLMHQIGKLTTSTFLTGVYNDVYVDHFLFPLFCSYRNPMGSW